MHRLLLILLFPLAAFAQDRTAQLKIQAFNSCKTSDCQLAESIRLSEYFVEVDHMDQAQQWLNHAKKINQKKPADSISYFINSLQSEIFYYMELYQFGMHEAEKGIERGRTLNDSAFMADAYFFKGINEIEINLLDDAQKSLWHARKLYPKTVKKHLRTIVGEAYLYNNLAQVKLKIKQLDSAVFYNRKVYDLAISHQNYRGIVNGEQTFGLIYNEKKKKDSAIFYMNRSLETALRYGMEDIATINCAYLMQIYRGNPDRIDFYYQKGQELIAANEINNTYLRYFYAYALEVYKQSGDTGKISDLQQKIIDVNEHTNVRANYYLQNIMERYMTSENKLLVSKINELNQERNIRILQLVAALFGFLVLLFVALFFRRKNRLQRLLLDQKNEISKDLHDDIGSELSSIMINANILQVSGDEKQRFLIDKISTTTTEISQRLNAFIWSLNNENDSTGNFTEYVKHYTEKLLEGSAISVSVTDDIAGVSHKILNGYFRKNLFFCVKEAINNAIRHSDADAISIHISGNEKNGLQVIVRDNGIGISETNLFGNGFNNMRKRVAVLKGSVKFENSNGLAVIMQVSFP